VLIRPVPIPAEQRGDNGIPADTIHPSSQSFFLKGCFLYESFMKLVGSSTGRTVDGTLEDDLIAS
jgi:hypothetical protein